jgi:hypothetical protein
MSRKKKEKGNFEKYTVKTDAKLGKAFPKDIEPPALLFDFAAWLRDKPWGSVGTFSLTDAKKIGELLLPGADENDNFAMFMGLPDGGLAGLWFKDTRDAARAPFVRMSSEAQFQVLAPNFALFLFRLAQARFDSNRLSDFLPPPEKDEDWDDECALERDPQPPDLTGELGAWLAQHPVAKATLRKASRAERAYEDDGQAQAWLDQLIDKLEPKKPKPKARASDKKKFDFEKYDVDSDGKLKKTFPKDIEPPALLLDFAAWLRDKPEDSVGKFGLMNVQKMDDSVLPGAKQKDNFAIFLITRDYGAAGLWFKDTRDPLRAPFVVMDSYDELKILAPNLPLFLHRLAQARFDSDTLDVFLPAEEDDDGRPAPNLTRELGAWLAQHPTAKEALRTASKAELTYEDDGHAQAWLDQLMEGIEKKRRKKT